MREVRAAPEAAPVVSRDREEASAAAMRADDGVGRVRPESYPGEWDDLHRAARRRHLRRGISGWAAVVMMLALSACTTTVALTAGGLVGYAGYSIYRLAEAGRSWTAATYEFLFTPRKADPAPPGDPQKQSAPACSWSDRLRSRC